MFDKASRWYGRRSIAYSHGFFAPEAGGGMLPGAAGGVAAGAGWTPGCALPISL